MKQWFSFSILATASATVACLIVAGCTPSSNDAGKGAANGSSSGNAGGGKPPVFSLAWSEYPSWSVFGVADKEGLLDGKEGAQGSIEKKWNVDIVLNYAEYDPCLSMYGSNTTDAVCITNIDILSPSLKRASVAIMPTSTSVGGDACIAVGVENIEGLKGKNTWGLEKSVSQFAFERALIAKGMNPKEFPFKTKTPPLPQRVCRLRKLISNRLWFGIRSQCKLYACEKKLKCFLTLRAFRKRSSTWWWLARRL